MLFHTLACNKVWHETQAGFCTQTVRCTSRPLARTGMLALLAAKDFCMRTTDATAHHAVPRPAKMNSKISPQPQKLHVQHCGAQRAGRVSDCPCQILGRLAKI